MEVSMQTGPSDPGSIFQTLWYPPPPPIRGESMQLMKCIFWIGVRDQLTLAAGKLIYFREFFPPGVWNDKTEV